MAANISGMIQEDVMVLAVLVSGIGLLFVLYLVIKYSVRSGLRDDQITSNSSPGTYRVLGVDRATKMDTTWQTKADSADNAKAKGELEGIVVTRVERVG